MVIQSYFVMLEVLADAMVQITSRYSYVEKTTLPFWCGWFMVMAAWCLWCSRIRMGLHGCQWRKVVSFCVFLGTNKRNPIWNQTLVLNTNHFLSIHVTFPISLPFLTLVTNRRNALQFLLLHGFDDGNISILSIPMWIPYSGIWSCCTWEDSKILDLWLSVF